MRFEKSHGFFVFYPTLLRYATVSVCRTELVSFVWIKLNGTSSVLQNKFNLKPEYTEAEIVAGCVQNDRTFQELLYRRHFAKMMQMCLRYTNGDRDRALQILNDGFLRIFKKINTFEFKGALEGWIRRLVFHAISDYFKANRQYMDLVVFEEPEHTFTVHSTPTREDGGLTNLYFEDILKLVDMLPPATREVFRLYAIDGYNHSEIAKQLGISVGTSKWHLSTAREKLKTLISENNNLRLIIWNESEQ